VTPPEQTSRQQAAAAWLCRCCEERTWRSLFSVVCVALALRVFALWTLSRSIYGANLMPDEQVYAEWARRILDGAALPPIYDFPRAPAYVFAGLHRAFGPSPLVIRVFDVVLGTATCALMFLVGRSLRSRVTGIAAAALTAVYGPCVLFSVTVHNTALSLFAFALLLVLAAWCSDRPSLLRAGALGVALAAVIAVRPNALILAIVLPAWLIVRGVQLRSGARDLAKQLVMFAAALALFGLPAGVPEPAFNLYTANTLDNPSPYFRPVRFASSEPAAQATGFVIEASRRRAARMSLEQAHDFWLGELAREFRQRPGAALHKIADKLIASVHPYEAANNHNLAFISHHVTGLGLPYATFAVIFALAAAAFFGTAGTTLLRTSPVAAGLLAIAIGYWSTLVVFFADSRIRAPLGLALIPFAAVALDTLLQSLAARERRHTLRLCMVAALAFGLLSALRCPGAGDLSTAYNFHALFLFDAGQLDAAQEFYRASTELGGSDSDSAYLGLSAIAERQGDLASAARDLGQIPDAHYKAAEKYLRLGALDARAQRFDAAIDAFEHSLAIDSSTLEIYPVLIALYERHGASDKATGAKARYEFTAAFYADSERKAAR
jgi:hypothetical protein